MNSSFSADVFEVLHELLHLFRNRMMAASQAMDPGVTFNELRVLMHVGRTPGLTQKALVDHSHTDKAQMARTLAQLEDKGWLLRSTSASDKRMRCLQLSAQGQALFTQLQARREQLAQELLQHVPPAQQQQLLGLLGQALGSARDAVADASPRV